MNSYVQVTLQFFFPYREHIQTNSLLQLLYTNPSNINHTMTNLRQFCYILEMIRSLKDWFMQLCTTWWWAS